MNILVANNHLVSTGGTENYTYTIIVELLRLGHNVEYFTFEKGEVSSRIEALGVKFKSRSFFDLIIANHIDVVDKLYRYGCIIQTCHGTIPRLEQPSFFADYYVAISAEVKEYLSHKRIKSILINNCVDCNRFYPRKEIHNNLTSVLSLCQSEEANIFIEECCREIGVSFKKLNKFVENLWEIQTFINDADLVVGIGRSLYDAMACGRTVISYDNRSYSKDFGDGYLNKDNIEESLKYNCSGRGLQKSFTKKQFIEELRRYKKSDGVFMRDFALEKLNIELGIKQYLGLASPLTTPFKLKYANLKKRLVFSILFLKQRLVSIFRVF